MQKFHENYAKLWPRLYRYLQGTAAEETTDKRSTISASSATTSTKKEALTETKVKHEKQNCAKEIP